MIPVSIKHYFSLQQNMINVKSMNLGKELVWKEAILKENPNLDPGIENI